jgi:hypothetical protein
MELTGAGMSCGSRPPPSKGYSFLAAYDNAVTGGGASFNYAVTMSGSGGTLVALVATQHGGVTSVVYDPTGSNVTLTQNASLMSGGFLIYSGTVPAASGSKNVTVTYTTNPAFTAESFAFWLATGLTTGYDSSASGGADATLTVNSGDFLFAMQYTVSAGVTNTWTSSTQSPTGSRLSTIENSAGQFSASADWSAPSAGSFTVQSAGAGGTITFAAAFK